MSEDHPPLNVITHRHVSFEELEDALKAVKNARPAAFAVGDVYGSVCAPHMVPPSEYLPHILGSNMELPDPRTADQVISFLHSLHNHLATMIEDNKPLNLRRKEFGSDKNGLLLHASDLWREVVGFRTGLSLGTYEQTDIPKETLPYYEDLAREGEEIRRIIRRIDAKRKPYTEKESTARQQELMEHGKNTARLMRTISHQLYLQRMNVYKAQGVIRIGRNDPCPCGSGKKFKHCCLDKIKPSNAENN